MAILVNAYTEEDAPTAEGTSETRVVMKFHPKLAPMKAAIFPLVNRDGMPEISRKIEADLRIVESKLNNKSFVDRAPIDVVELNRHRQKNYTEQLRLLKQAREKL